MRPSSLGEYCQLNDNYTFQRFIRGDSNLLASSASQAVADTPSETYNPLFLHGGVGLGKTHLLHAIGNRLQDSAPWMRSLYITSERFTNELVDAIRDKNTEAFRERFRQVDLLMIDDVHFLKDRTWTQEELFHTFNELYEHRRQIVLTSDRPPDELSQLQERLVSRFRWGLVAEIRPPDLETRLGILRAKARENGLQLDEGVLTQIAKRVRSSVRALEGALIKVTAHMDLYREGFSNGHFDELLPAEPPPKALSIDEIKREVAGYYSVSVADIEGESRVKAVAQARQMAVFLAREHTNSSFPVLGQAFGGRNHSTIMHAYKKAKALLQTPLFTRELEEIRSGLLSG